MFTGLIEAVGQIVDVKGTSSGMRLRIRSGLAAELKPGESLAVNGVCLTVIVAEKDEIHADVGPETARISSLGGLRREQIVNLERSLRADGRLGGHFVQGHVDGTGTIDDIRAEDDAHWLTIAFPPALAPYMTRKGSIALDGVSLTIAGLGDTQLDVMIIPFTWQHTNLGRVKLRDRVNLECDMIGKFVVRSIELAGLDGARWTGKAH